MRLNALATAIAGSIKQQARQWSHVCAPKIYNEMIQWHKQTVYEIQFLSLGYNITECELHTHVCIGALEQIYVVIEDEHMLK